MTARPADPVVTDHPDEARFTVVVDGQTAELTYRLVGSRFVLVHTGVPDALGGRGIGGALVQAAVDRAVAEGLTIVPSCPFARHWLEERPDVTATVEVDWDSRRGDGR